MLMNVFGGIEVSINLLYGLAVRGTGRDYLLYCYHWAKNAIHQRAQIKMSLELGGSSGRPTVSVGPAFNFYDLCASVLDNS